MGHWGPGQRVCCYRRLTHCPTVCPAIRPALPQASRPRPPHAPVTPLLRHARLPPASGSPHWPSPPLGSSSPKHLHISLFRPPSSLNKCHLLSGTYYPDHPFKWECNLQHCQSRFLCHFSLTYCDSLHIFLISLFVICLPP